MVPGEILEDIFAYLSRDDLEHCEMICLKWSNFIEGSKRLAQRRVVSLKYKLNRPDDNPNNSFWMELKVPTGKIIRIEDDPTQQELPAFRVFRNVIIEEFTIYDIIDFLEERWAKILKLTGGRIIVKSVYMTCADETLLDDTILKRFHDLIPKYIDAEELTMKVRSYTIEFLCDRESWKYLDFGKKIELSIDSPSNHLPNNFSIDIFEEFISGRYLKHTKLNELNISISEIDRSFLISSIVEAFCNTVEPQKFFNSITVFCLENFDQIIGVFGFVRDDLDPQKYRLSHPKLGWALEATQPSKVNMKFKCVEL